MKNKKVLKKGSLGCFNMKMKYWIFNPHKWEVCTLVNVPDNKFKRMRYFNESKWLK